MQPLGGALFALKAWFKTVSWADGRIVDERGHGRLLGAGEMADAG
jgi:hypothetical protein